MGEVVEISGPGIEPGWFASLPGLVATEPRAGGVRIVVESAARALAPVAAAIAARGCPVERLEIHPVDLERVFMHLTGRALRD
jgi:hypothetical protein